MGQPARHEYVVVGAGPCGLSAARTLSEGGTRPVVLEREAVAGGLASSYEDAAGFVWDQGAHVAFSHFGEFDGLLDDVMDGDVYRHERSSYVVYGDRWVPYPFQHNLARLADDDAVDCLIGLINRPAGPVRTFDDWLLAQFGTGIVDRFMRPYNSKVWTVHPREMSAEWVAERVATVDWQTSLSNLVRRVHAPGWGPNSTFVYPGTGGIGEPFRRLAGRLPDVRYRTAVASIDPAARVVTTGSGERIGYDRLVSTMPLTTLVEAVTGCPAEVRHAAQALRHNQVIVVGVGATGAVDPGWHWLYFPDREVPFYRVTNLGLCSPRNVPDPRGGHVSYMAEIAVPAGADAPPEDDVLRATLAGLRTTGLLADDASVVSTYVRKVPMAYPIPTLGRTEHVATILEFLEGKDIYSRGRFGVWMYEYGNMDHAVKMGIDVARRLLSGSSETVRLPHVAMADTGAPR